MVMDYFNVPGTVSGRLRSSAPHMRSVRMNDMIRQRHLHDGFLKAQGTSTFTIVNPECPIRRDKVTTHLNIRRIQNRATPDMVTICIKTFAHSLISATHNYTENTSEHTLCLVRID